MILADGDDDDDDDGWEPVPSQLTVTLLFYCLCCITLLFHENFTQEVESSTNITAHFRNFLKENINHFHPKTLWTPHGHVLAFFFHSLPHPKPVPKWEDPL